MKSLSSDDRLSVMDLVERETAAFWNKDFDAWQDCCVHAPYVRRWGWWAARGGQTVRDGWDQQVERMRDLMRPNPEPNASVRSARGSDKRLGRLGVVTLNQVAPTTAVAWTLH